MGERWRNWYRYEGLCLKRTWDRTWPGFTLWLAPNAAIPFVLAALLYGLVRGAESMTDYVIAGLCGTAATAAWGGAKFLWYYVTTPALVHAEQVEEIERLKEDLWERQATRFNNG